MFNKRLIETLKNTINNLENELIDEKLKVSQRDILIGDQQKEIESLKEMNFCLYENLTPKKKEKIINNN